VTLLVASNALLWLLLLALCVVVLALLRQIGILHERLRPVASLALATRPTVGARAPALDVTDVDGRLVTVGAARADGKSTLVLFISPACPVCKTLLPALPAQQMRLAAGVEIVLAGEGEAEALRVLRADHGLAGLALIASGPLAIAYQVGRLPHAVLIDGAGVLRAQAPVESAADFAALIDALPAGVAGVQATWRGGAA
jgi:methylamine dehydrogenase accessory protein MauD